MFGWMRQLATYFFFKISAIVKALILMNLGRNSDAELYHFIGKDIVYFHSLFWPAMLEGERIPQTNQCVAHGYYHRRWRQMSKSGGTFIRASTYLNHIDPELKRRTKTDYFQPCRSHR